MIEITIAKSAPKGINLIICIELFNPPSGLWFFNILNRGFHPRLLIFSHFYVATLLTI